jgi:hypothetical protein
MREQEMRLRVFRFLKVRMRNMIMPAAMGIGLAASGCDAKAKYMGPLPSDAALVNRDVNYNDMSVLGPEVSQSETREAPVASDVPETGQDVAPPVDQSVPDQAPARDVIDTFAEALADVPLDGKPDLWFPEGGVRYEGPMPRPDASLDIGIDTGGEAGPIIAKYIAPMPDAAMDLGLVVRYMAQMPDSGA